jgi:hypothetical protein
MGLNFPSGTRNDISLGPGQVFIGPAGATPTVDIGFLGEDGVSIEINRTMVDVTQGNPKVKIMRFIQEEDVKLSFSTIEWNPVTLAMALGAANTTSSGSVRTFSIGGDPTVDTFAIHVRHRMASVAQTINAYFWTVAADGQFSVALDHNPHNFPFAYTCLDSPTNWAGTTLAYDERLFRLERQLT